MLNVFGAFDKTQLWIIFYGIVELDEVVAYRYLTEERKTKKKFRPSNKDKITQNPKNWCEIIEFFTFFNIKLLKISSLGFFDWLIFGCICNTLHKSNKHLQIWWCVVSNICFNYFL